MENDLDEIECISQRNEERGAQVIQIDSSKHVAAVAVCAAICGVSLAIAIWAGITAEHAQTEYVIMLSHQTKLEAREEFLEDKVKELEHANRR